jgi:glycerophosphoryl diester phosphodiesterase
MECLAHRGFAAAYPENTLPAVQAAARESDGVEVDVRRCGSGELVTLHDETVDRVTDSEGHVSEYSADELEAMSVYDTEAGIPLFAAVLSVMPPDTTLHAELKEPGLAQDVADIAGAGACDVIISSTEPDVLETVPDWMPRAYLFTGRADKPIETAQELGCTAVHPHKYACLPETVENAHDVGLSVNTWTITELDETESLRELGVDGVIVDSPEYCPSHLE